MFRKIAISAVATAIAVAGLAVSTASSASAAITIQAGAGSNVHCRITGSVKISPALKDNWLQSQHTGDPNAAVKNLPDNLTFASTAPQVSTTKFSTVSCTGSVTDGVHTANVTKAAIVIKIDPAHNTTGADTCIGFARQGLGLDPPSTARYIETIKWTATGAKVASTTVTDTVLEVPAAGFATNGGTISGSFQGAGGTAEIKAYVDDATTDIFTAELTNTTATSTMPAAPNVCQAGLKIKGSTATLKAPKGMKGIKYPTTSTGPGGAGDFSSLAISR